MANRPRIHPSDQRLAWITLSPSIAALILLVAVPMISVFALSVERVDMGATSGPFVGLDNYRWALANPVFYRTLWHTFVWVFGTVAIEMVLGLGLAVLLSRHFVLRGTARAILLAPYLVPTVVAVMVWRYMFHDVLGIINIVLVESGIVSKPLLWLNSPKTAMMSVIIVSAWKFYPFAVIAFLGVLQSIPQEQYEAARIDGASGWQQFWRITLPYVTPVLLLTALLRTIWAFNKFDIIYLLTGGGPIDATTTLPVLVYLKAFSDFELGRAAAVAVLALLILVCLLAVYFWAMKHAEARQ